MKNNNTHTTDKEVNGFTPGETIGYENMPAWCDSYRSYRKWAKACFDAGKKERQTENEKLLSDVKVLREVLQSIVDLRNSNNHVSFFTFSPFGKTITETLNQTETK